MKEDAKTESLTDCITRLFPSGVFGCSSRNPNANRSDLLDFGAFKASSADPAYHRAFADGQRALESEPTHLKNMAKLAQRGIKP